MKTALYFFAAVFLVAFAGCESGAGEKKLLAGGKQLITVDFQEGQTLRYRFVSSREIEFNWDPTTSNSKRGKEKIDKSSESMDMVVAYTPVKVNPYGLTTIEATCESVRSRRTQGTSKDAVESLPGTSFTFTVGPSGKIEDYSQLEQLIKETGEKAFRQKSKAGRVKEPDMISDFIATQWFLWDSVSSIEKAAKGVRVGQSWKSKLLIPTPMVARKARDVTYALDEIRQSEKGQLAVIRSSYSLADSVPQSWPMPYSGSFQMSGRFGFLRGYKFLDLQGQGEEMFNIDAGRIEQYNQQYQMKVEASFPMGLGTKPLITISQKLTMTLLE
ncbi:MAG: hypothetical protein JW947_03335 [Sedimentisphaerales bacterium]|nr:hypothetical protein [Sedimentisphaerales bacterium]